VTMRRLALAVLAAVPLAACATGAGRAPPVASPQLFVDCRGAPSASPTVILEAGAFGSAADWDLVLDDLARGGRVCAYDRAGIGRSPPRTGGPGVTAVALELRGLLDRLGERRPVILVGHSNGALYAETFAAMWPERVAGLVYVNGVVSDALDHPDLVHDLEVEGRWSMVAAFGGDVGLSGQVSGVLTSVSGFSGRGADRKRQDLSDPDALRVARDEDRAVIDGLKVARNLGGSPRAIPTAVIGGSTDPQASLSKSWRAAEEAPARRATRRMIIDVPDATHTSPLVRDRGYVVTAVDWLRGESTARARP
jgi:pimeloyl-ACP methyl ester carboxylesterase